MLRFSFCEYSVLQWSMSVSKGTSTSRTKDVRSTDLSFNLSLLLNFCVVGIRAHYRPRLARPLMSLILSLMLIPLFIGLYISTQLINFSIALPHLYCFIVNVVSRFWSNGKAPNSPSRRFWEAPARLPALCLPSRLSPPKPLGRLPPFRILAKPPLDVQPL